MIRALALAGLLALGCGKAKDDSPRGRCERGCKRMDTCMRESLGSASSSIGVCIEQCLAVGPPDDARLEVMETKPCREVIPPGAKIINVPPRPGADVEGPIQTPGDHK